MRVYIGTVSASNAVDNLAQACFIRTHAQRLHHGQSKNHKNVMFSVFVLNNVVDNADNLLGVAVQESVRV
jgi:hypothetical protein